jgi:hypothetical protein
MGHGRHIDESAQLAMVPARFIIVSPPSQFPSLRLSSSMCEFRGRIASL